MSRLLVVDADVGRACGAGPNPTSLACQRALGTLLEVCHRVVVSEELRIEWDNNAKQARMFRRWLKRMFGQKKVAKVKLRDFSPLARQLEDKGTSSKEKAEILKDVHLLAAALQCEAPVMSLDRTARGRFSRFSATVPELQPIVWVNPALPEDGVEVWLCGDAPSDSHRRLGPA